MSYADFVRDTIARHEMQEKKYASWQLTGERRAVPRTGKNPVDTIWYRPEPEIEQKLPVVLNMHGGGFTDCDAVQTGSFCRTLADALDALIISVNYKKAPEYPYPYAIEEICDVIAYLFENAQSLGIDTERIAVSGESAGASLATATAMKLANETDFALKCQVLVYPCTDLTGDYLPKPLPYDEWLEHCITAYCGDVHPHHPYICHMAAPDAMLAKMCPAVFVTCELDFLGNQADLYAQRLIDNFVPVSVKRFKGAVHGFLEVNRPDWGEPDDRITPEQDRLAREAEAYIIQQLRIYL